MGLLEDLVKAMRWHMLTALPPDPTCTLRDLDLRSMIGVYAAWRGRVPTASPRRVHVSRELLSNPSRAQYGDGLAAILREIAEGGDLRPRMSTGVAHAYSMPVPWMLARKQRDPRHVDRLLADWGIHHLHLRNAPHARQPDFLARSPHVLFAAFLSDNAYLIDLREHESDGDNWSELAILETVVRNWPDATIMLPSLSGLRLRHNWNDEDRRDLRRAGLSGGMVEIDDQVWLARSSGQSVNGEPSSADRHGMSVYWTIYSFESSPEELQAQLDRVSDAYRLPRDGWAAAVHDEQFGFLNGHVFHSLGALLPS
jgi:hypothetical protein